MKAALVTIGDEILIGQVVDTNSAWIANQLNQIGISVGEISSISDSGDCIKETVRQLFEKYDIIITTGGLGPTRDDITKQALCEYFQCNLIVHKPTLEHITYMFAKRGMPLTNLNAQQAEVPDNCTVLSNPSGTAPGMLFTLTHKSLIVLPGVPFEMKDIMELHVLPMLKQKYQGNSIIHKVVHVYGLPESFLAEKLEDWEDNLPENIKLAYLPSPYSIRLRLTHTDSNNNLAEQEIQDSIEKLYKVIPNNIFGYDNDSMASVVGDLLTKSKSTLSLAESCTGGNISHLLTEIPGSSVYFKGAVVAYSNEIKINELDVKEEDIEAYGAVSQQVVEAMAQGIMRKFQTHYSIATSGIAGPTGATPEKPVGTLWVAVASKEKIMSQAFQLSNNRERNIIRGSITALNMLRLLILAEKK